MRVPLKNLEGGYAQSGVGGIICCLCICATIAFVAYHFAGHGEGSRRLWSPTVVEPNGRTTSLGDSRQLEFWTPSARTRDYLTGKDGEVAPTDLWQVISNDDAVLQFGSVLHSNQNVLGYRRIEVFGQGRTGFKAGWWWTLNVLTNYSEQDLGRAYEGFWKSHQVVFVEVIDNRGRTE
jgi:hypothetical protein